jgi:hypothetical protein
VIYVRVILSIVSTVVSFNKKKGLNMEFVNGVH